MIKKDKFIKKSLRSSDEDQHGNLTPDNIFF